MQEDAPQLAAKQLPARRRQSKPSTFMWGSLAKSHHLHRYDFLAFNASWNVLQARGGEGRRGAKRLRFMSSDSTA